MASQAGYDQPGSAATSPSERMHEADYDAADPDPDRESQRHRARDHNAALLHHQVHPHRTAERPDDTNTLLDLLASHLALIVGHWYQKIGAGCLSWMATRARR